MSRLERRGEEAPGIEDRSLEGLYRRHAGWLTALLRKRFGPAVAEDLTQETYLRIAHIDTADIVHPRALLARTAVHLGYDQARYHGRRSGMTQVLAEHDAAEIDIAEPASQDASLTLKVIVLGLPPLYRDVFLLARVQGLTHSQIAVHLGISMKTVERRMAKALSICTARLRD